MNVTDHTQRVFDSDLGKLTQMVAEMGGLAQKQVTDSIDALARHDVALARRVIALDGTVDDMLRQIEEKAVATIALRQPAHLGDHLREFAEIAVEDALGVVGHIHDLVAAVSACLAARYAHAIQPLAQSAFNALMILRFMRDDAMTLRVRKDQTALGAEAKKALRDFVV